MSEGPPQLKKEPQNALKEGKEVLRPPSGWRSLTDTYRDLGKSREYVENRIEHFRKNHNEWVKTYKGGDNQIHEYFSPELFDVMREESDKYKEPEAGWIRTGSLSKDLKRGRHVIEAIVAPLRDAHPELFKLGLDKSGGRAEFLAPEAVHVVEERARWQTAGTLHRETGRSYKVVQQKLDELEANHTNEEVSFSIKNRKYYAPRLLQEVKEYFGDFSEPEEGWDVPSNISKKFAKDFYTVTKTADEHRKVHPEWFHTFWTAIGPHEHYSPELIETLDRHFKELEVPEDGWMTANALATELGAEPGNIRRILRQHAKSSADDIRSYQTKTGKLEHYSPVLIDLVRKRVETRRLQRENETQQLSINNEEVEKIQSLAATFGAASAVDILYATNPRFKSVPVEQVQSMLAEYLGNYLLTPRDFNPEELAKHTHLLEVPTLREGLRAVVKEDCLKQCYRYKEENPEVRGDAEAFGDYFLYIRSSIEEAGGTITPELDEILRDVEAYYGAVLSREMPGHVVEQITADRPFPDLYQRINIQELHEKNRLLIADEMGVGKSGSAILAAESLGSKTVLAIVPSNVIPTWEDYLSDKAEGGKQIGYFKPGQAPRTLVVEEPRDLEHAAEYDYILISQERLGNYYSNALKQIEYDMLIVDEVHKLKNLRGGVRASHLLDLIDSSKDRETHMALLSGTPVPNKVEDVAILLKLLHPDRFGDWEDSKLVSSIIHGNLLEIRALLVPYMQMKELNQHIEMPKLDEKVREYDLSDFERDAYEVLLEEDELTPTEKMQALRQFLLNPRLLDIAPETPASKLVQLQQEVDSAFESGDKVLVFTNSYTEGVLSGEQPIMNDLHAPPGVTIETVYGGTSPEDRLRIQTEFQSSAGRMLLLVSGQTADVGVDYSRADHLVTYNEPWTEAARRQQLARSYRPGRTGPLEATTLIARGTIEQGMHEYIALKHAAITKLLRNIPLNELEQDLLQEGERMAEPNREVNPELARYYFSSLEKLNKMFAAVKQLGEEKFRQFLEQYGEEYAACYQDMGSRSYQSNVSRMSGTLLSRMSHPAGEQGGPRILDIASGPEMLKHHALPEMERGIVSLDLNKEFFKGGDAPQAVVGSFIKLPFANDSFDLANFALALHYTRFVPSRGVYERLEAFREMRRVLKPGGRAVITLIHSIDLKSLGGFKSAMAAIGLDLVDEYSGAVSEGGRYETRVLTLEKRGGELKEPKNIIGTFSKEQLDGLKLVRRKSKLKDSRKILSSFKLGNKTYDILLNEADQRTLVEERGATAAMKELKSMFGTIESVPPETLRKRSMARLKLGKRHILFKRLSEGGVVIEK